MNPTEPTMLSKGAVTSGETYECVRCGTRVTGIELSRLPSPTCANCGYRTFRKVGDRTPKSLKAR
jgi:DNA-directed RNA polymerase subunit RPC12/RpoP